LVIDAQRVTGDGNGRDSLPTFDAQPEIPPSPGLGDEYVPRQRKNGSMVRKIDVRGELDRLDVASVDMQRPLRRRLAFGPIGATDERERNEHDPNETKRESGDRQAVDTHRVPWFSQSPRQRRLAFSPAFRGDDDAIGTDSVGPMDHARAR